MDLSAFQNIEHVYRTTSFILSIGLTIAALEDLQTFSVFQSEGLLSWKVSRLASNWLCKGPIAKGLMFILNDFSFKISLYLRLIFSVLLFAFSLLNIISAPLLVSLFF